MISTTNQAYRHICLTILCQDCPLSLLCSKLNTTLHLNLTLALKLKIIKKRKNVPRGLKPADVPNFPVGTFMQKYTSKHAHTHHLSMPLPFTAHGADWHSLIGLHSEQRRNPWVKGYKSIQLNCCLIIFVCFGFIKIPRKIKVKYEFDWGGKYKWAMSATLLLP